MQHDPAGTQGPNRERSRSHGMPRPTDEDYKGLYDDLMTLRQSWTSLLDPQDPAQWEQDGAAHVVADLWPEM